MQDNRFGWNEGDVVWDLSDVEEWAKERARIEAMAAKRGVTPAGGAEDAEEPEDGSDWWAKHLGPVRNQRAPALAVLDGFCRKAAGRGINPFAGASDGWITVHPNGLRGKGVPVLIGEGGKIEGGMGGKFNGKTIGEAKKASKASKSGGASKDKPKEPSAPAKTSPIPDKYKEGAWKLKQELVAHYANKKGKSPEEAKKLAEGAVMQMVMINPDYKLDNGFNVAGEKKVDGIGTISISSNTWNPDDIKIAIEKKKKGGLGDPIGEFKPDPSLSPEENWKNLNKQIDELAEKFKAEKKQKKKKGDEPAEPLWKKSPLSSEFEAGVKGGYLNEKDADTFAKMLDKGVLSPEGIKKLVGQYKDTHESWKKAEKEAMEGANNGPAGKLAAASAQASSSGSSSGGASSGAAAGLKGTPGQPKFTTADYVGERPKTIAGKLNAATYPGSLSPEQGAAMMSYSGSAYAGMNSALRKNPDSLSKHEKDLVNTLDSVFEKASTNKPMTIFRGIHGETSIPWVKDLLDNKLKEGENGSVIHDDGFLSTSASPLKAKNFASGGHIPILLVIDAPKGAKGVSMKGHTHFEHEKEILFNRGTKMKVAKISEKPLNDYFSKKLKIIHVVMM